MSFPPKTVTIIGAGLGGLTLALSLQKFGIRSKMIELRTPDYDFGGAIMLSPNALRVLDSINVYNRIKPLGFTFKTLTFKNDPSLKTTGKYYFGDAEQYDYDALRIYRNVLIAEIRKIVHERGIPIEYGRKYSHIISEDENGVKFALADGTEEVADILIGADGIHSKVRQYIFPDIVPEYAGFIGVTYAFPRYKLRFPPGEDVPLPVSIHDKNGAFVLAPQNPDGQEIFVGRQFKYPLQTRSGWDMLLKSKTELIDLHQNDMKEWCDFVQSGQEQASSPDTHALNIWPFHMVPKMNTWISKGGKVIITGDAAHAIPPTAGQGANQAFEDAYGIATILKSLTSQLDLQTAMSKWHDYRQERINKVLVLSDQMNTFRLSEAEKKLLPPERVLQGENIQVGSGGELSWLYSNRIDDDLVRLFSASA
jgi:2-polyprenyl-6-methoxyphenol hydroxylase-like FAD-dependent oxidoreductase